MMIKFKGVSNPRECYDFGPVKCDRCSCNSTAFLEIKIAPGIKIVLCKGCLVEGEDIINKTILSQCQIKEMG